MSKSYECDQRALLLAGGFPRIFGVFKAFQGSERCAPCAAAPAVLVQLPSPLRPTETEQNKFLVPSHQPIQVARTAPANCVIITGGGGGGEVQERHE
jgi:hypothetical protein